jgi:SNF2 family DNA or RNA helicase
MGLGKTRTAVWGALLAGVDPLETVILCPAAAVGRWEEEWARVERFNDVDDPPHLWSYDKLVRGSAALPSNISLLICDEAHRLKNADATRTRLVLGKEGLAREAEQVWFLSGTPTPNHPGELYTILASMWPELLRQRGVTGYFSFLSTYTHWTQGEFGPRVFGVKQDTLRDYQLLLDQVMLRRTWESPEVLAEMAAMPQINWIHETVSSGASYASIAYDAALGDLAKKIEAGQTIAEGDEHLATVQRAIGIIKAPAVAMELIDELAEDPTKKMVVFAYHTEVLNILERSLEAFGVVRKDGNTAPGLSAHYERMFQSSSLGGPRVFLGQISACKESLTLTAASQVEIVESLFSPEDNVQAAARIRRHGQFSQKLQARVWGLANSFDQDKARVVARKARMIQEALG